MAESDKPNQTEKSFKARVSHGQQHPNLRGARRQRHRIRCRSIHTPGSKATYAASTGYIVYDSGCA